MSMTTAAFIGMGAVVFYGLVALGLAALHGKREQRGTNRQHKHG
ncbi:hypothetical protein ACJU26_09865 [Acidithiobacillus sp. M4-SHS-6]